jgi:eukaryotic translation initiation factor 2C
LLTAPGHREGAAPRPDGTVARIEAETEAAWKQAAAKGATPGSGSVACPSMPQRPGFGTLGRPITLWANFFGLTVESQAEPEFFRYNLKVTGSSGAPDPTGKKLKRVVRLLLDDHLTTDGNSIVTDFAANLFSRVKLEEDTTYRVRYRAEGEEEAAPDAKTYEVRVGLSGSLTVSDLLAHLSSPQTSRSLQSKEEIVQALTLIAGWYAKADASVANVGANRHYPLNPQAGERFDLGGGLVAVRGFFMSVRTGTARLLVNVQVKHAAFFQSGPLATLVNIYGAQTNHNKPRLANFLRRLSVDLIHITNRTRAGKRVPRYKTVVGLATRDDGRKLEHPPKVSEFGAGSRDVQFWLNDSGPQAAGKKKGRGPKSKPQPASSTGKYISVYDHFTQSKNRATVAILD